MSALTHHDAWLSSPVTDEPAQIDIDAVIDEMIAEPDTFDSWLNCPSSVAGLLSLILDRGLPCNDESSRDDELCDMYSLRIQSVRDDFARWAQEPQRFKPSPIESWRSA